MRSDRTFCTCTHLHPLLQVALCVGLGAREHSGTLYDDLLKPVLDIYTNSGSKKGNQISRLPMHHLLFTCSALVPGAPHQPHAPSRRAGLRRSHRVGHLVVALSHIPMSGI